MEKGSGTLLLSLGKVNLHVYNILLTYKQFAKIYDYLKYQKIKGLRI